MTASSKDGSRQDAPPPLAIIVAMTPRRVIGRDNALPWRIPEDLAHFKAVTMGHAILMGRKTYESIGRALPGRRSIVLSRTLSADAVAPGVELARDWDDAVATARRTDPEPFVIGGAALYERALPVATHLFVTEVMEDVDGDTFFPAYDERKFRQVSERRGERAIFREFVRA